MGALALLLFALCGCGSVNEHLFHDTDYRDSVFSGRTVIIIPPAPEAITLLMPEQVKACFPESADEPVFTIRKSLTGALNAQIKEPFQKQKITLAPADSLSFSYSLPGRNLLNIAQPVEGDTTVYLFTIPAEKFLLSHGFVPDIAVIIAKINFTQDVSTEGYYRDGIFHGGETAVLKAGFEFVIFDYKKQRCISYGDSFVTTPVVPAFDRAVWNSVFSQIGYKLFSGSPFEEILKAGRMQGTRKLKQ
jgi:hypothetical protein